MHKNNIPPLSVRPSAIVGDNPFDGDLLSRKGLAASLTLYIDRLKAGAVLAIDAEWGEGKTWLGRNWAAQLKNDGHKVVFIDAFEQDYIEDPFLLIASEIAETIEKDKTNAELFVQKASDVMTLLLPITTKTLINVVGQLVLNKADLADNYSKIAESILHKAADTATTSIENRIKHHAAEKKTISSFKSELESLANSEQKPIVIFIDELDRCNPVFAVRMIERIKHLFEVPNIIFILLMNRKQLENAIKGVYGQETDANAYLGKFLDFNFKLPKKGLKYRQTNHYTRYVNHVVTRFKFDINSQEHKDFIEYLIELSHVFDLTLRDIEKCVALYAFAYPASHHYSLILAYSIVIKTINPSLYKKLLNDDDISHKEAIGFLSNYTQDDWCIPRILLIHRAYASEFTDVSKEIEHYFQQLGIKKTFFSDIARTIDLSFEF
jgi:hypothetical protein